jgi:hypothetical protein
MGEVKFGKETKEWGMFVDYWQFVQKYYIPEPQDEWWEELISEADKLARKYGNTQYIRDLVLAHIHDVERRYKSGKENSK